MSEDLSWQFRLAKAISIVGHPALFPIGIALYAHPLSGDSLHFHLCVWLFLILLPGTFAYIYLRRSGVSEMYRIGKRERNLPLLVMLANILLFGLVLYLWLPAFYPPRFIAYMVLLNLVSVATTVFWKISIHLMGWGALLAIAGTFGLFAGAMWLPFLMAGFALLLAWARIRVGSHDLYQVAIGWLTGILVIVLVNSFYQLADLASLAE